MPATGNIREHMEVLGSDGMLVGIVDHMSGDNRIKLTRSDSEDGEHHFISTDLIDHVDEHVHLSEPADAVKAGWEGESTLELDDEDEGQQPAELGRADKVGQYR